MAFTPDEIGGYFSRLVDASLFTTTLKYLTYLVYAVIVIGVLLVFWFAVQYYILGYRISYPVLHYARNKKSADILRYKTDYGAVKKKGGQKFVKTLFGRKHLEPFTDDVVKPGRRVNLAKINEDGTWELMPSMTFQSEGSFETLTPTENAWVIVQLKENAATYQNPDVVNKMRNWMLFTIVLCLVLTGVTIWLALKSPAKIASSVEALKPSLEQLAARFGGGAP